VKNQADASHQHGEVALTDSHSSVDGVAGTSDHPSGVKTY
jgi:hypothetical protein